MRSSKYEQLEFRRDASGLILWHRQNGQSVDEDSTVPRHRTELPVIHSAIWASSAELRWLCVPVLGRIKVSRVCSAMTTPVAAPASAASGSDLEPMLSLKEVSRTRETS